MLRLQADFEDRYESSHLVVSLVTRRIPATEMATAPKTTSIRFNRLFIEKTEEYNLISHCVWHLWITRKPYGFSTLERCIHRYI